MNHRAQNLNIEQISNCEKFNDLPETVRLRLLARQNGQGDGFAFKNSGILPAFIMSATAIIWLGIVFYFADDYIWSQLQTIIFGLISLVAFYLLIDNLYKIFQWFTSHSKNYLLITPHYMIETRFNDVWYWDLDKLTTVNSFHQHQNGKYVSTKVTLSLEQNLSKTFDIKNLAVAEETVEQIQHYKKLFAEALARNDTAYLESNDDFPGLQNQTSPVEKGVAPSVILKYAPKTAATILLGVGVMFGAVSLNNYCDDKKSWEAAENVNRASSFRKYLHTHPQGRWRDNADQKLQNLYDAAEQKYQTALNKESDKDATNAVLQVLRYAKTTQNYRVNVVFERHNEISPNVVEELKKEFEVKRVLALGDTFSEGKMQQRERQLFVVTADAFRIVIPDDILEISDGCAGECVTFLITYNVNSGDSLYYDLRQEKMSDDERTFYPGIFIDWDFDVKIPNQPQSYSFKLASSPATEISYDSSPNMEFQSEEDFSKVLEADKNYIYDSMVSSAFDDFKTNLIYRMGIGQPPKKEDENMLNTEKTSATKKEDRKW